MSETVIDKITNDVFSDGGFTGTFSPLTVSVVDAEVRGAPKLPQWLRAHTSGAIGVDRANKIIRGFVVAQEGPFKTEGRGEFDMKSLRQLVKLMKTDKAGLKSRFTHPTLSDDGLGKFLGRAKSPVLTELENGTTAVRADLHLSETSFATPSGDLGTYVLDLAESDPDAMSSSLVLKVDEEFRLDKKGQRILNDDGESLPPLWRPTEVHAIDVVDTGDAVDGFLSAQLSADGLPDEVVRQASALLSKQFAGQPREVVRARVLGWLDRYLDFQFGDDELEQAVDDDEAARQGKIRQQNFDIVDTETYSRKNKLRKIIQKGFDTRAVH